MSDYVVPHTYPDVQALIDRVIAGEHVVITRDGEIVAELVAPKERHSDSPPQAEDAGPSSHEALQALVDFRNTLPPLGMTSVEFLRGMHEEARD